MATALKPGTTDYTMRGDRELVYTRVLDAPRDLAFAMFTEAEHLPNWMGMEGDVMKIPVLDLREGGKYRCEWYRDDELLVVILGEYTKIVPGEYVENTETMEFGETVTEPALCSLTFTEKDGQTTVVGTMIFPDADSAKAAVASGMKDGMDIGFDRLDALLAKLAD